MIKPLFVLMIEVNFFTKPIDLFSFTVYDLSKSSTKVQSRKKILLQQSTNFIETVFIDTVNHIEKKSDSNLRLFLPLALYQMNRLTKKDKKIYRVFVHLPLQTLPNSMMNVE